MPLPKSAPISARATEVYSETCPLVLKLISKPLDAAEDDDTVMKQVLSYLPFLRQLITCCACAGVAEDSMISVGCGHCYCYECQFREPLLKIQCRQCKERKTLVCENQLRIIVKLYKEMVMLLSIHFKETSINETVLNEIIQEVIANQKVSRSVLMVSPPIDYLSTPKQVTIITPKKATTINNRLYSGKTKSRSPRKTKARKKLMIPGGTDKPLLMTEEPIPDNNSMVGVVTPSPVSATSNNILPTTKTLYRHSLVTTKIKIKKHEQFPCCRCGTNPLNKSRNSDRICARRKCPCYLSQHGCKKCKCRGCHNPYN